MSAQLKAWAVTALTIAVAFCILTRAVDGDFLSDDSPHLVDAQFLIEQPSLPEIFDGIEAHATGWGYRPGVSLSFYLQVASGWKSPFAFRTVNLLIHLLNLVLIWILILRFAGERVNINVSALVVATFFLFHPSVWHTILYISGRSTLLVSTFILFTAILSMNQGWKRLWALPVAFLSAMTKETGLLALPIGIVLNWPRQKKRDLIWAGAVSLSIIGIGVYRSKTLRGLFTEEGRREYLPHDWAPYVLGQIEVLWKYLTLILLPIDKWSFFHWVELRPVSDWADLLPFLLGLVTFLAILVFSGLLKSAYSKACFAAMVLCLVPEIIYPRELLASEQRLYLPLASFSALLALKPNPWTMVQKIALVVLLSLNLFSSFDRAGLYGRPVESILLKDIERYPNNAFSKAFLGAVIWNSTEKSLSEVQMATKYLNDALRTYAKGMTFSRWTSVQAELVAFSLAETYIYQNRLEDLRSEILFCENIGLGPICQLLRAMELIYLKRHPEALEILSGLNPNVTSVQLTIFELLKTSDKRRALEYGEKMLPFLSSQKRFMKDLEALREQR